LPNVDGVTDSDAEDLAGPPSPPSDVAQEAEGQGLAFGDLHPLVRTAAGERWDRGDYAGAVRAAWFALRDLLRERLGRGDLDGENLVNAIGETAAQPALPLTDYGTLTEQNIHRGVVQLLRGAVFYVRHPDAHESESPSATDRVTGFECLTIMSLCARYVAAAASPTALDDAFGDLMEPRFAATPAALEDIVQSIPRRRFDEFLGRLYDAATAAFESGEREVCEKLHNAHERVLIAAGWDPDLVGSAARRAERPISRDETLEAAMRLLHGPVFNRLSPRYREKVVAALEDLAPGYDHVNNRRMLEAFDILPRVARPARDRIYQSLIRGLERADPNQHAGAAIVLFRERSAWTPEETSRMAQAIIGAIARHNSNRLASLVVSLGSRRIAATEDFRNAFESALREQTGIDAPGASEIDRALAAFTQDVVPDNAAGPASA
jgi:uncharacterized protein (TIGR02391 family)